MTKRIILSLFAVVVLLAVCPHVWGEALKVQTARILRIKGTTMVYHHQSKKWSVAGKGIEIFRKDIIKTLPDSEVDLLIADVAVVRLKENTTLELAEISRRAAQPSISSRVVLVEKRGSGGTGERNILKLTKGTLLLWIRHIVQGSTFEVETPIGVAGVRGTRFVVRVLNQDTTVVAVLEGIVEVRNIRMQDKTMLLRAMETSTIHRMTCPSDRKRVSDVEHDDLRETLQLKLLREGKKIKRKPGSKYNGMHSSSHMMYWETDSADMGGHESMSGGSTHDGTDMMDGGSTTMGIENIQTPMDNKPDQCKR